MLILEHIHKWGYVIAQTNIGSHINMDLMSHEHLEELDRLVKKLEIVPEVHRIFG